MIEDGDRIMVAFSGGKDSFAMIESLAALRKKAPVRFDLVPLMLDISNPEMTKAAEFIRGLGLELTVIRTGIITAVEKTIKEGTTGDHCFLCSRLRRGRLSTEAKRIKCNKIALGHNLDDALETFLLNFFYTSSTRIMRPIYKTGEITIIRPLIGVPEHLIAAEVMRFPTVKQNCPFKTADSKRALVKEHIKSLAADNRYFYSSVRQGLDKMFLTRSESDNKRYRK
jgi:tRNA 2-thiocytidine biosynthesis protein TtcA